LLTLAWAADEYTSIAVPLATEQVDYHSADRAESLGEVRIKKSECRNKITLEFSSD